MKEGITLNIGWGRNWSTEIRKDWLMKMQIEPRIAANEQRLTTEMGLSSQSSEAMISRKPRQGYRN